jgi:DNA repair protein RadC
VAHNHPSGDPEPTTDDLLVTDQLAAAGKVLGVELLDHLIIASKKYISLTERSHHE